MRVTLLDIGDDVRVTQHRAFRRAVRARGEENDGGIVGVAFGREHARHLALGEGDDLVADVDRFADIFEIDELCKLRELSFERLKFREANERARRQDLFDVRRFAGRAQI